MQNNDKAGRKTPFIFTQNEKGRKYTQERALFGTQVVNPLERLLLRDLIWVYGLKFGDSKISIPYIL